MAEKTPVKRKPPAAFMKPMQPDAALGAAIGNNPMPRTEVMKQIWVYIKKNNLQDANKKTLINADDVLLKVFNGKKQVTMFEMTKLIYSHLEEAK